MLLNACRRNLNQSRKVFSQKMSYGILSGHIYTPPTEIPNGIELVESTMPCTIDTKSYKYTIRMESDEFDKALQLRSQLKSESIHQTDTISNFTIPKLNSFYKEHDLHVSGVSLYDCKLHDSKISIRNISDTLFNGCIMPNAIFDDCWFGRRSNFLNCYMPGVTFNNCKTGQGDEALFYNCVLDKAIFNFPNERFEKSEKIIFDNTSMEEIDLTNCNFPNSILVINECEIYGMKVKGCRVRALDTDHNIREYFEQNGGIIEDSEYDDMLRRNSRFK